MLRLAYIAWAVAIATLFAWLVPIARLFEAFQPLTVMLSIFVAAIFVRLNRGMPTLEWKSIEYKLRARLTSKIADVVKDYCWIVSFNSLALSLIFALTIAGSSTVSSLAEPFARALSGGIGFLLALCVARMGYVVWRDFDIVRLQKFVIDQTALSEEMNAATSVAQEKIAAIKAANLKKPDNGEVKPF